MNRIQAARKALPPLARRIDVALGVRVDADRRYRDAARARLLAAGCTPADLAAWRAGLSVPTQGQLARLAAALGVTFLWLHFGGRGLPIIAPRARG